MATIRKQPRKNGYVYIFQVRVTDKGSKKQIVKTKTWVPDEDLTPKQADKMAQVMAEEFEKEIKSSLGRGYDQYINSKLTFREYSKIWLEKTKRDCSIVYYTKAKNLLEEINSEIGGYELRELNPQIIQTYYNKLDNKEKHTKIVKPKKDFKQIVASYGYTYKQLKNKYSIQVATLSGAYNGKNVSIGWAKLFCQKTGIGFSELFDVETITEKYAFESIHIYKRTIRAILSQAKKNRLIENNYASAEYIYFPKRPPREIKAMDDKEAKLLYETLAVYPDIRVKTALLIFLLTGFRRGEVTGLEWGDIDFEKKTITVNRSVVAVTGVGLIEKSPKTATSIRTITIPDLLINQLVEYKKWQEHDIEMKGDYFTDTGKLFTQTDGKTITPGTFKNWFNKICALAGIDHYTLHSIRHTNITLQLMAGVPLVTVSARAGHARTSTTSDIYAHVLKSSDQVAAETIDNIFGKKDDSLGIKETQIKKVEKTSSYDIPSEPLSEVSNINLVNSYRKAKEEMKRLGFTSYDEYLDYLEFENKTKKRDIEL